MSGCCAPASAVAISRATSAVSAAGSTGLNCAGSTVYGSSGSSITSRGPTRYPGPDLVVVLDEPAQDAALVAGVLDPVDPLVAAPGQLTVEGVRRSAGEDEHRDVAAHRVADLTAEVLGTPVDVHDNRLGP